jgi:AAA+ superfamily predicted ATPase
VEANALVPKPTDRAFFVGQTGSGKTTLARELLKQRRYVVVLDGKGLINWDECKLIRNFKQLGSEKADRIIWRPSHDELRDEVAIDRFFEWVYLRGNTTCYVDEVMTVAGTQTLPPFYHGCITRGREHGVEMWSGTQRPTLIPQVIMSEAEHVFMFKLKMEQDRDKMAATTGIDPDALRLPKHQFYYAPQDDDVRGPLRLRLRV